MSILAIGRRERCAGHQTTASSTILASTDIRSDWSESPPLLPPPKALISLRAVPPTSRNRGPHTHGTQVLEIRGRPGARAIRGPIWWSAGRRLAAGCCIRGRGAASLALGANTMFIYRYPINMYIYTAGFRRRPERPSGKQCAGPAAGRVSWSTTRPQDLPARTLPPSPPPPGRSSCRDRRSPDAARWAKSPPPPRTSLGSPCPDARTPTPVCTPTPARTRTRTPTPMPMPMPSTDTRGGQPPPPPPSLRAPCRRACGRPSARRSLWRRPFHGKRPAGAGAVPPR